MANTWRSILFSSLFYRLIAGSPALIPRAITAACQDGKSTNCITSSVSATTKTGVVSGKTITETLFPTTLSEFSTITAPTTVTTTDATGATVLAILGVAGAGYLAYIGVDAAAIGAGIALEPPPLPTVKPPEFSFAPTTTEVPTTTTVSSSRVWTYTGTQTRLDHRRTNLPKFVPLRVPRDVKACNAAGQDDLTIRREYALDSISSFCKDKAEQDVSKGLLTSAFSPGSGKVLNISVSALPLRCKTELGQTKMHEKACKRFLGDALDGCDTNSNTEKHGGSIKNGCFQYSLTPQISSGQLQCTPSDLPDLPSLPGAPNTGVSYAPQTGMNRDEALANIFDFCSQITAKYPNGRDVHPGETDNLRWYYNPSKGNTQMNISLTYSEQVSCAQSGDKAAYRLDRESCKRLLNDRLIDGCNTNFKGPWGKFGGTLTDGCGYYAIQTKNVEPIVCNSDGETISETIANAAIDQFCNRGYHLDPNPEPEPEGKFLVAPLDGTAFDNYVDGNLRVETKLSWDALPQNTGCQNKQSRFAVAGDDCQRRLRNVFSKCSKGGRMGAQQQEGCVIWQMTSYRL